jgi:uncharacterized glyoxalase superfamily protein PhnB
MKFPSAIPEIPVSDLLTALAYYRDCLGFTVDWTDEALGLAGLSQGASRVFMGAASYRAGLATGGPAAVWFNVSSRADVDELHARWQGAGAEIAQPPAAKPWKLYEFLARDPDGNMLRVFYDFAWEERESGA